MPRSPLRHPLPLAIALAVVPLAACSGGPSHARAAGALSPSGAPAPVSGPTSTAAPTPTPGPTHAVTSPLPVRAASSSAAAPRRTPGPSPTAAHVVSPSATRTASPAAGGAVVAVDQVTGDRFSPMTLTAHVGDTVLVTDNDAVAPHTFTIAALGVDSGSMSQGQTFRLRLATAGRYTFVCTYHQAYGMTGTLTVLA